MYIGVKKKKLVFPTFNPDRYPEGGYPNRLHLEDLAHSLKEEGCEDLAEFVGTQAELAKLIMFGCMMDLGTDGVEYERARKQNVMLNLAIGVRLYRELPLLSKPSDATFKFIQSYVKAPFCGCDVPRHLLDCPECVEQIAEATQDKTA